MPDRPDGADLLRTAREELLEQVMPQAPAAARYRILMIANAMAIAARELDDGGAASAREQSALGMLLAEKAPADAADRRRQLCRRIRAGEFDYGDRRAGLMSALRALVRDKLSLSNPKLLSAGSPQS